MTDLQLSLQQFKLIANDEMSIVHEVESSNGLPSDYIQTMYEFLHWVEFLESCNLINRNDSHITLQQILA